MKYGLPRAVASIIVAICILVALLNGFFLLVGAAKDVRDEPVWFLGAVVVGLLACGVALLCDIAHYLDPERGKKPPPDKITLPPDIIEDADRRRKLGLRPQ